MYNLQFVAKITGIIEILNGQTDGDDGSNCMFEPNQILEHNNGYSKNSVH